jgi:Zn ribbon nucleic-acid-binding protein
MSDNSNCAHEGTMGAIDLDTEMVSCVDCGYSEPADPDDIANHIALRDTGRGIY